MIFLRLASLLVLCFGVCPVSASVVIINDPPVQPYTAPVAVDDEAVFPEHKGVDIPVLLNDSDLNGRSLSIVSFTQPEHGKVKLLDSGVFRYLAGQAASESESFTYTIGNGTGLTATATVKLTSRALRRTVVASSWSNVPGAGTRSDVPEDVYYTRLGVPALDGSGGVAFAATFEWIEQETHVRSRGIIAGSPAQLVVKQGDVPPDKEGDPGDLGETFAGFRDPLLNIPGDMAFSARLDNAAPGRRRGIWLRRKGAQLREIVRAGDPAPGVSGGLWQNFISLALTDAGPLLFVASLVPGRGGVTSENSVGLWAATENGAELLLRNGQAFRFGTYRRTVKRFAALAAVPGSPGHDRIAADGSIAVRITWNDGAQSIAVCKAGATPKIKLTTWGELYDIPGTRIARFGLPGLNRDGVLSVRTFLQIASPAEVARAPEFVLLPRILPNGRMMYVGEYVVPPSNPVKSTAEDEIILTETYPSWFSVTFREGSPLDPSRWNSPRFVGAADPVTDSELRRALVVPVGYPTIQAATGAGQWRALYWTQPQEPHRRFFHAGTTIQDWVRWRGFHSIALPDAFRREPIFMATYDVVQAGTAHAKQRRGLWAGKFLIAGSRAQSPVSESGSSVRKVTALSAIPGSPAQRRSYNDNDEVAYHIRQGDGREAIVVQELP